MTDTKHTPTPWTQDDTVITRNSRVIASVRDLCTDSQLPEDRANAAHIVRCVNAHDELVAALRNLVDETDHSIAKGGTLMVTLDAARAALAKAGS